MSVSDCLPRKISSSIDQDGANLEGLAGERKMIECFSRNRIRGFRDEAMEPGNPLR